MTTNKLVVSLFGLIVFFSYFYYVIDHKEPEPPRITDPFSMTMVQPYTPYNKLDESAWIGSLDDEDFLDAIEEMFPLDLRNEIKLTEEEQEWLQIAYVQEQISCINRQIDELLRIIKQLEEKHILNL